MAEWPTTSVTSAEIVDGSIVDADVAAGAAIQASKLSGVETPAGAQTKADAAQAAAEATAASDATTKANAAQSAAEATAAAALTAHEADTTSVHGIADTSVLETSAGAQSKADAAESAAIAAASTDATTKANAAQTAAEATAASALSSHEADTTSVHGIADTSALETTTGAQAKADAAEAASDATAAAALAAHESDTTSVHGITDTSTLIVEGDARLTDERTPTDGSVTAGKLSGLFPFIGSQAHASEQPQASLAQFSSARYVCGVQAEADGTRVWTYNSGGFYQQDTYTGTIRSKTLPTNVTQANGLKVVADDTIMWLCGYNTSSTVFEVYSAPLVSGTTSPTWTGPLVSLAANATMIPTAFRIGASGNLYLGEYAGGASISGGPTVYRSTDGTTFSAVLGPLATTRHIHGVYEDPFNATHVYVTVGDSGSPHYVYRSTDGGATFSAVTTLSGSGNAYWQAVAMGFTADWVWFFSDQYVGGGPYVCDRSALTPVVATLGRHDMVAVPGGAGGRTVTDLATTSGDATVTSATAAFTAADVGRYIRGPNTVIDRSYITAINSGTSVELSQNATGTNSGLTASITSDMFYGNAYAGAVDPDTGWAYMVANDATVGGNIGGIFIVTEPGAPPILWKVLGPGNPTASQEVFIEGSRLWVQRYGPIATMVAA